MYLDLISYLDPSWQELLKDELNSQNFANIIKFLNSQTATIYPPKELIFNAFNLCKPSDLKVIIIGQDPYHNPQEAMGLAFSVPQGVRIPPSLKNIFKELIDDINSDILVNRSSDLSDWARQGVLLLNSALTVEKNRPASHAKIGWQGFISGVIKIINLRFNHCVFMLWGNHAKALSPLIDPNSHLILQAAHPSPLARGAFFGSRHFSKCNEYLLAHSKTPIKWL
ncbi:uracil-DNA glycosylase, family 1 [Campylobacter lanienae NCTC 13004]|uniref:Uracil-DNA glycosylase n=1 Tax=Campylobacter lanienae NCTC 13004 TaxID=1031753 RepID=A0A1X9SKR9_9BACT|nr:uracil-DNA glycosylase [Campylobacter lanienae]ARQ96814.1 uracil-DNA glycosylase, family 1 [Campylobacter lanienae NCTC 13004]